MPGSRARPGESFREISSERSQGAEPCLPLTVPADHAGVPGHSIPAGLDSRRLPIGVQLPGPDFSEGRLLRIGRAFEMATETEGWGQERPRVLPDLGL
jgi:Asp-tRNA(Asn)/Glu-tRNA(Gln) amidotransferase A subunit family amidase